VSIREREVKLTVPAEFDLPPLTDPGGDVFATTPEMVLLDATYYDAEDLRLGRAGVTLRHRDDGWTLKLPAPAEEGLLSRDEHSFAGPAGAPPDAAVDLVRAYLRAAELAPVARLRTTRWRVPLHDAEGKPVAEVVDDHVELDESDPPVLFREVEIELADSASEGHRAVLLARLRAAGAGPPDPTPKLVRALGPRATAPPDIVVPTVDQPTVELIVRHAIASSVAKLVAHDPGVRLGGHPEDLHQARVASRRLRSHLRTFQPLVDEAWARGLADELRWLGDVLGGVRDADVLLERLEAKTMRLPPVDRPPSEKLLDVLRADRDRRRGQVLTALRGDRYLELLEQLVLAARRPRLLLRIDDDDDREVLRNLVRRPWAQLRDAVDAFSEVPTDAELHEARIKAKRLRYAAEAVEPAFGRDARNFARAITELQDVLGSHQDAVVAGEWLRRTATRAHDEASGFAAGQLAALELNDSQRSRDAWSAAWKRASRRKLRDWL